MRVVDAAFDVFRHFGVDAMFGNPGSTEMPLLSALPDDIGYVLGLNEAVVLGMADGYAQATGRAALVNLHSSAGTGNAMGNLFTSYRNNTPIVVTAGQQARSILPFDPFLGAERPTELPQPFVKWACEPARAEDVPLALARAFHIALTPPTGPVFVSIPVDDWMRECEQPVLPAITQRTLASPEALAEIADMLNTAKHPAIVIGSGLARAGGWQAGIALVECLQADVWCAPMASRETFPETHLRFAGFLPAFREQIAELLAPYDAILVIGAPAFTYHAEGSGAHWPAHAKLALISDDPRHLARLPGGTGVLGDPALAAATLAERCTQQAPRDACKRAAPPSPAMSQEYVCARIAALRSADSIIVEEAPTARGPMHDNLPISAPNSFYTTASGGLGYALPAAIGIARARREQKTICLLGDGSAMYSIQGLWSAAEQNANVSFIVLNNRRYAALDAFSARFGTNHIPGTELGGIDFAALAESVGVSARRANSTGTFDDALSWSLGQKAPSLVEILLD